MQGNTNALVFLGIAAVSDISTNVDLAAVQYKQSYQKRIPAHFINSSNLATSIKMDGQEHK